MITLIEALNFRCLRYVRQPTGGFHVLVGPNASGKTTFLDVAALLGRFVSDGLEAAIHERTQNFQDLIWRREGRSLELAIEAAIPEDRRRMLANRELDTIRYEVCLRLHPKTDEMSIMTEKCVLKRAPANANQQRTLFPIQQTPPQTILSPKASKGTKTVVNKVMDGNDNFYDETGSGGPSG